MKMKVSSFLPFLLCLLFFFWSIPYRVEGATIISSQILTGDTVWSPAGNPYVITGVQVASGGTLTILPGTTLKLRGVSALYTFGTLTIGAPGADPVVITSFSDDTVGGDTNNDGSATVPTGFDWCSIGVHTNASLSITNTSIRYGGCSVYGQVHNFGGNVTITDSKFFDSHQYGILNASGSLTLTHSEITGNVYGVRYHNGTIVMHDNNIHGNSLFGVVNTSNIHTIIDATNNGWGSDAGPFHAVQNPGGLGNNAVSDFILFDPWLRVNPLEPIPLCTSQCYSSILFLPGLEASRLYRETPGGEDQLWEPGSNSDVEHLFMDNAGKSIRNDIYTRDAVDGAYLPIKGDVYKSFLTDLATWKNDEHLIADYAVAPYDWRLPLSDILSSGKKTGDNLSYLEWTDTPYIVSELRRLAGTSKSGKVTIIAHSNGGLVAKMLADRLGAEASQLIDKIVFVAVPQSGTPQAIGAILHGYDQGLPIDWFPTALSPKTARTMANNIPSAYGLLPSSDYFTGEGSGVTTPVIAFDPGPATDYYIGKYGEKIDSSAELHGFLMENEGKVPPDSNNLSTPSTSNPGLLLDSEAVRQQLDGWTVPAGVELYQIAGFGNETVGTIKYWNGEECLHNGGKICSSRVPKLEYTPEFVVDGDGTVVAPSALAMSDSDAGVSRWWVDLADYNIPVIRSIKHVDILEVAQLRNFIKENILTQTSTEYPDFISDYRPSTTDTRRLRYFLHSPLALSAHDGHGNIISATEDTYPGATYQRFGEVQYISVPADSIPTLTMDGLDSGSFTLEIEEVTGETVNEKTVFSAIPTTSDTGVTMDFPDGTIAGAGPLLVDYDGDSTTDFSLLPVPGGTVILDTIAPATTVTMDGVVGSNDWYTSAVTVTMAATDDEGGSGVAKTEYSLDDGVTWQLYSTPFALTQEGASIPRYFSTDKQGNKEEMKSQSIKIDTIAPEGKIVFDPATQKLAVTGTDNLGGAVIVVIIEQTKDMTSANPKIKKLKPWFDKWLKEHRKNLPDMLATLTDEAGHTTSIAFEKTRDRRGLLFVRVRSLGYDGNEADSVDALVQYKWQIDAKNQYRVLETQLHVDGGVIESRYIPKKDETWIMEKPQDLTDDDRSDENDDESESRPVLKKLPGIVIPGIVTEKGNLNIKY